MNETSAPSPSLLDFRKLVEDLYQHDVVLYWVDMVLAALVGWGGLVAAVERGVFDLVTAGFMLASAFGFLRAVLFIHELSHFRRGVMPGFSLAWNLLVGVPLLVPSFMYVGTHTDHHKRTLYGTIRDPEYLPLASLGRGRMIRFVLEMLLVPPLLVIRYGLLTPLSWLLPPLRRLVIGKMSALAINPDYDRALPTGGEARRFVLLEALILAWIVVVAIMLASHRWPLQALWVWYGITATVAIINQVRTLAAHVYSNDGGEISTIDQLLDSCNVRGLPIITELCFPVGLRYHALHHLLADMPYHNLGKAHRRLVAGLPADSPYHRVNYSGLIAVARELWRRAGGNHGLPEAWKKDR
ncbi:MAG: fatty acid desaturase [Planctomycetes bacterium]|nr:fatty acid desaturase [Planctomycetota bacterium]